MAVPIIGRDPDCPDCAAQMQAIPVGGVTIWRCPWTTSERRFEAGVVAGVDLVACSWPMARQQGEPGRED